MDVSQVLQNLQDNLSTVIAILASLGIAVDVTPFIKVQPVRAIGRWIRKQINKDVMDELKTLKAQVDKTDKTLSAHIIESQRQEIIAFSNECIKGEKHTKEAFDHIIDVHTEYLRNTSQNNIENGKVDLAYRVIEQQYLDCINNNDFL